MNPNMFIRYNPLDIDEINKLSPYKVNKDPLTGYLYFVTKNGIQLVIDFIDDDLIPAAGCYQLGINNANNRPSPRDIYVQKTILLIKANSSRRTCQHCYIYAKQAMENKRPEAVYLHLGLRLTSFQMHLLV